MYKSKLFRGSINEHGMCIMDTALPQKFPFNLDRNLAKANSIENRVCTSCDTVDLALIVNDLFLKFYPNFCLQSALFGMTLLPPFDPNLIRSTSNKLRILHDLRTKKIGNCCPNFINSVQNLNDI